ncbi:MAG TPA: vitamin K epoxide reductase family protein [Candidatus Baltobacteraceae bacterium]|nr:vitamin K epoxide reductase family protein [Candidatus Baltobacteraceae bacterium]
MVTILEVAITVLCGVGLYVSLFMLGKTRRAARGLLNEPSVVQTPQARLYGRIPNAALGIAYYTALAAAVWLVRTPVGAAIVLAAVAFAAVTSFILAYSLLFITKRACPYCWTGHAINWSLAILTPGLFKTIILFTIARFW